MVTSSNYRVDCDSTKSSKVFVVKFVDEGKLLKKSSMIFCGIDSGVVRWACCGYEE